MNEKFERIYERLSPTLKRICHRLNGHFSFFNDDDLLQEAAINLWLLFRLGKLADKTDSYMLQGCYFHLKNYIRTAMDRVDLTSMNRLAEDGDSTLEDLIASGDTALEDHVNASLLKERVGGAGLTEREKDVLSLSLDGLTVREIGKRMGISHVMVIKIRKAIRNKCRFLKSSGRAGYHN
ncbi:MAG: sigma-70 family RNA polymerase sigma factor [Candidatus Omnitrophota bacterium]